MRPDYELQDELSERERANLNNTPTVRFGVGPSTLERPLGVVFTLPIGLVKHSSKLLRHYFSKANTHPDTGSLAAAEGIYLLPDEKPEHFDVLAAYICRGRGTLKSNLGKSILACSESVGGKRIYKVVDIDIDISKATESGRPNERVYKVLAGTLADDAVQRLMPQALMFLAAAEEVNTFISLCDKLSMNKAIWTAIASYDLIIRFAIMHSIPFSPSSEAMMPWGPLGDVLRIKNEEVRKMMPNEVFDMCRGVVGAAYGRHMLMREVIDEETKVY